MNQIKSFINANATAYAAASKVFKEIEGKSYEWADQLASAGIVGNDVKPFAVAYVAEQSGKQPHNSERGGLTFKKDTAEYNRVKYLVRVATGAAAVTAAKRSSGKVDIVAKALELFAEMTPAQKRSFKAQL